MTDALVVQAAPLRAAIEAVVRAAGSEPAEAALVAAQLVEANLTGHDSHGVGMIPRYVEAVLAGELIANAHVAVVRADGPFLVLDGQRGYGQVMGHEAMERGITGARDTGVVVMGLSNTHHLGRIGHWAEQCARAGLVSIHFVNVMARPIVAPWGGRDARFGTNPFCVGIPRDGEPPILLDFATSRVAQGKVRVAFNKGEALPPGALLDDRGEPTVDPKYAVVEPYGAVLPFAEHKGYALAIVCELLGGALAGGPTFHGHAARRRIHNGMLSILMDPARLGTADHLAREIGDFVAFVRASPLRDGVERIRMPGEPETEMRRRRGADGIPIDATTWAQIVGAAGRVGLAADALHRLAGVAAP